MSRTISIFLASSSELKGDREQFEIFINRKNKEYNRKGIFLELVMWEDFLDAMSPTRLQDEYNKTIAECDVFVSLFYTKVGQYTEEEFLKALATFKANKKLLIYTYFKDKPISPSRVDKSLGDFKAKLSKLGHFYKLYKNIDQLKYLFNQQLEKFLPNLVSISSGFLDPEDLEIKREESQARDFKEFLAEGIELEMVFIPGNYFKMGSPEGKGSEFERPERDVNVPSFYMGKYPVTQAQYQQIIGNNPSSFKGDERSAWFRIFSINATLLNSVNLLKSYATRVLSLEHSEKSYPHLNYANRPVENVSWDEAKKFCKELSKKTGKEYNLPSEAQWEYACRAGTTTSYYFGEKITANLVNFYGTVRETTDVGKYPPNNFGLYDMHGNVWEWCDDDWHIDYKDELMPCDGSPWFSGNNSLKVLRGGSWAFDPSFSRSAYYFIIRRDVRINDFGFRVVCVTPKT